MQRVSRAGQWYLAGIGFATAAAGVLFCVLLGQSYLKAHAMRSWPEVPCVILASGVKERRVDSMTGPEYQFAVQYGYEWEGKALTSERHSWRGSSWTRQEDRAKDLVKQFPVGLKTTCRVYPADPSFAVLKMDSQAAGYSIWFPGLFVVGGLGIAIRALWPRKSAG